MKEAGTTHWIHGCYNSSGFTGLPGGYRNYNGSSTHWQLRYWWSSTEDIHQTPGAAILYYNNGSVNSQLLKTFGFSVALSGLIPFVTFDL
jgi:hypothetical protein